MSWTTYVFEQSTSGTVVARRTSAADDARLILETDRVVLAVGGVGLAKVHARFAVGSREAAGTRASQRSRIRLRANAAISTKHHSEIKSRFLTKSIVFFDSYVLARLGQAIVDDSLTVISRITHRTLALNERDKSSW